jgi:kynurenine formamidase
VSDVLPEPAASGNWGRWGAGDETGLLHLMTPERIRAAAALIREGRHYALGMPVGADAPLWPLRHKTWKVTAHRERARYASADDVLMLHSHSSTHMDALAHVWYEGRLFNGHDARESIGSDGASRNSIDRVRLIAGRAVLFDIALLNGVEHLAKGEAITAADLDRCAARSAIEPGPGDILLVRTGWIRLHARDRSLFDAGEPGLDTSTIDWLHRRDVLAVGADNHGVEVMASIPPDDIPFHRRAIRDLGLYLLENLWLEDLSRDGVRECFLVVAPLPIARGVGSPIQPIAFV